MNCFFLVCFGQGHGRLCKIAKVWTLSTLLKETAQYEQPPSKFWLQECCQVPQIEAHKRWAGMREKNHIESL